MADKASEYFFGGHSRDSIKGGETLLDAVYKSGLSLLDDSFLKRESEMNIDLNAARIFVEVVNGGSLSSAAKKLKLSPSSISDKIAALEKSLGLTLMTRTTRSMRLTEEGKKYFEKCEKSIAVLVNAFEEIDQAKNAPAGMLRITCPAEFAYKELAGVISNYRKKFPNVDTEVIFTNELLDLNRRGIDIAIRGASLKDSSLKAIKVGVEQQVLISSSNYLKSAPKILKPQDLQNHQWIHFSDEIKESKNVSWDLVNHEGKKVKVRQSNSIKTNSFLAVMEFVNADLGVGLVPLNLLNYYEQRENFVRVLRNWSSELIPVHLVFPNANHRSAKVREMIPLLIKMFKDAKGRQG